MGITWQQKHRSILVKAYSFLVIKGNAKYSVSSSVAK